MSRFHSGAARKPGRLSARMTAMTASGVHERVGAGWGARDSRPAASTAACHDPKWRLSARRGDRQRAGYQAAYPPSGRPLRSGLCPVPDPCPVPPLWSRTAHRQPADLPVPGAARIIDVAHLAAGDPSHSPASQATGTVTMNPPELSAESLCSTWQFSVCSLQPKTSRRLP